MTDDTQTRLLLVDDEADFLESMGRALRRRGFEVELAPDAGAALELLEGAPFDVGVFDVKMPGLDGLALFRIVKRRWPDLPVIILTGHGTVQQAFQTSREGVFEYLGKPCDVERLAELAGRAASSAAGQPEPAEEEPDLPPVRVLLVDDEEEFVASHERLLSRRGFEVGVASNGEEALAQVRSAPWDVAVIDLRMPGMDGLELLRKVKHDRPLMEVIVLTGQPSVSAALKAVREGAFDFVSKPLELEVLLTRIRAAARAARSKGRGEREAMVEDLLRQRPD